MNRGLAMWCALAVVFIVVTVGLTAARFQSAAAPQTVVCAADEEMREKIRVILLASLDEALKDHVVHAFGIWMKDETGQPERARRGIRQAISAYIRSREAVMKRLEIPLCVP